MNVTKNTTTKGGAAKEREKKIKLNVAAKSCQNIQNFFMQENKMNKHNIDDPAPISDLVLVNLYSVNIMFIIAGLQNVIKSIYIYI
jgi:hypothetical protein